MDRSAVFIVPIIYKLSGIENSCFPLIAYGVAIDDSRYSRPYINSPSTEANGALLISSMINTYFCFLLPCACLQNFSKILDSVT